MYADPFHHGPTDDMDAVSRREFFGAGDRGGRNSEPNVLPMHGNGIDRPVTPDPTSDRPLSTKRSSD